uniref:RND family efflux transporter, MFP subunit n=1 Tax=Candidatus Kentrum sp. DK TaxID=2126562 RepID=A0A450SAI8_9GAMM|nr:MAG: RND family efflux transporter, MFP subunit [Candidatus Kentron sp. DK]
MSIEEQINRAGHSSPSDTAQVFENDTASEQALYTSKEAWSHFGQSATTESFSAAWLDLQCRFIGEVTHGVVVLGIGGKAPYRPIAYWPVGELGSPVLAASAELAMAERRGVVRTAKAAGSDDGEEFDGIAFPVIVDDALHGVVAVETTHRDTERLTRIMRQLQWGCGWLEALVRRKTFTSRDDMASILELTALTLEHERFQAAGMAMATELANRLGCEWVAVGLLRSGHARVDVLSHSASFEKRTNLIRAIGSAMDEAMEQQMTLVWPSQSGDSLGMTHAHAKLAEQAGIRGALTIPLVEDEEVIGALTLARASDVPFDTISTEYCNHVAALAGPILDGKQKNDRWLIVKALDSARDLVRDLLGPGHVGLKLAAAIFFSVTAYLSLASGDYRISADAWLEGTVQRSVTAPMDGYIEHANFRAGDLVDAGAVLCALEDKDLSLERTKWSIRKEQRSREYHKALAEGDRAQVRILDAQIKQAEAEITLIDEQLARTKLTAPFDGIIVTGDLSQSLGSPVKRGDVLFEVAPLNSYRVSLRVDERSVSQVAVGLTGKLALAGLPGEVLLFTVSKITPVSQAEEGQNTFEVEASLDESSPVLRPGMEGVGKIQVGERKRIWIWTHKMIYWIRYWMWSWWP